MRYVSFLRAINTGTRRIKMADLRQVYVDLGYSEAATYIATGNVIFDSSKPPNVPLLESAFRRAFGFSAEVFLRDADEIRSLLVRIPWKDTDGVVEVSFLESDADPEAARVLEETAVEPEALVVSGSEVLFLREGGGLPTTHKESTSTRILGMTMTRRGLATIRKINERFLAGTAPSETTDGQRSEGMSR
jgi:uncharacterized protein (DUF1697 family)